MKSGFILLGFLFFAASCSKTVEKVQENLVIKAMTDGQWRLTKFSKAGTDMTGSYAPYRFQFYANNTVDAIYNGSTEKTGSWSADATAQTISSSFTNAGNLLSLLNGTWKITDNSWTYVEANQTVNGELLTMRLEK